MKVLLIRIVALFTALVFLTGAVLAQDPPDYEAWEAVAVRAEEAAETAQASDEAFEGLRAELDGWRTELLAAQSVNATQIAAVKAQISALGPKPEDGEEEAPEAAAQRQGLNARLNELTAPVQRAEVAHSRAEALIQQIDRILRERQTAALLQIGPSPLDPKNWTPAFAGIRGFVQRAAVDLTTNLQTETRRTLVQQNLPVIIALLTFGAVLILRGRNWVILLGQRMQQRSRISERWLLGLVMSLGQVVLPVLGLVLLSSAAKLSGLFGARGDAVLDALPLAGLAFSSARWLGGRIFPKDEEFGAFLSLDDPAQAEGRVHSTLLGVVLFVMVLLGAMAGQAGWTPDVTTVLTFPLIVLAGISLFRVSRLMLQHTRAAQADSQEVDFRSRGLSLVARLVMIEAVIGPVLAAVGYYAAGTSLVFPTIFTLMLLGLLVVGQRLLKELFVLVTGDRDGAKDALTPVLGGFVLVLASVPLFALIWGARVTDLFEIWSKFTQGFSIGETRISPVDFLTFVVVFAIGYIATRLLQSALRTTVLPKTKLDPGGQNAVASGVGYVGIFFAALIAITSAGLNLSSLAIVAGALSVGIGFGLQNIVSNFVSGIILLIERPVAIGDWIEVGDKMGIVQDISVRSTRIETFDRTNVIVPNADLVSGMVTNWTRGNLTGRLVLPIGVAYGSDSRKVEKILQEVAEAQPQVLLNPPPFVCFQGFGASSLDFEIRAILRDVNMKLSVLNELNHQIYERFAQEGIEIPFPQQDLWLRTGTEGDATGDEDVLTKAVQSGGVASVLASNAVAEGDAGSDDRAEDGAPDGADSGGDGPR